MKIYIPRRLRSVGIAIVLGLVSTPFFTPEASGQSLSDKQTDALASSQRIGYIDGRPDDESQRQTELDSLRQLVRNFYYDQFRNFQDPHMPYFMFMSKGSNLMLGVGGGVRMRAYYDWDGAMPTTAFSPYTIAIPDNPASPRKFNTTPSGTYLTFQAIGQNNIFGGYGLYIEADFTGYSGRDFTLKKAYANVRNFTVGYATSTFSDPAAQPPVVDAAGPSNKFSNTSVLVRYMKSFKNRFFVAGSVETPRSAIDVMDRKVKPMSNWLPDAAAFVQYQWADGQHVRLSGIIRSLSYLTIADSKSHNVAGWGVQLSAVGHPEDHLTAYGTLNYGHGYAGLGGDLINGSYDLVPDVSDQSKLYAPAALGWCIGLQYNILPNVFATVSASQTRYLPNHGVGPDEYRRGTFCCANIFWSIIPRVTVAAEYDWGKRKNFSRESAVSQRANVSCMFTF